jgi:hypothetical protein
MNVSNLRERIKAMPNLPPRADKHTWLRRRIEIRKDILRKDPEEFLGWSTVQECMFVGNAPYTDYEFYFLTKGKDRDRWIEAITDPGFGDPELYGEETTGNLIHQAFMIKLFEVGSGIRVSDLRSIVEFGGGYGAMVHVARQLGFIGEYVIYDLPEFSALQEYYLSNIGIDGVKFSHGKKPTGPFDLMIALWSLSEAPTKGRNKFVNKTNPGSVLGSYVPHWDGVNNWRWFTRLGERFKYVVDVPLLHMKESSSRIFIAHGDI